MNKVFVYGIFVNKDTRIRAFKTDVKNYPAILEGYELSTHSSGYFKSISEDKNCNILSIVMEVSDEQLKYLDRIEHVKDGMYRRITVNTSIGEAFVYLE